MRRRVPVYMDRVTGEMLTTRFGYCFKTPPGSQYPPILEARAMAADHPVAIEGRGGIVEAVPFRLAHGDIDALGLRIGDLAYAPDVSRIPEESMRYFQGLDMLIIDALRYTPHPSHFSVSEALALIERVKPRRAILTNLHTDLDYGRLKSELPDRHRAGLRRSCGGRRDRGGTNRMITGLCCVILERVVAKSEDLRPRRVSDLRHHPWIPAKRDIHLLVP